MKIAAINTVASTGNAPGRIMTQICQSAAADGHTLLMAYGRGDTPASVTSLRIGCRYDTLRHVALSRLSDSEGQHSATATRQFINRLENFNPDIIHLHNLHGYYINYPILMQWLRRSEIPVVWTLHDCWAFTGHCAYYSANQCAGWKSGCRQCDFKHTYPKCIIRSNAARNFDLKQSLFTSLPNLSLVAVSQWLANEVRQSFLGKLPLTVIHNGIDINVFKPSPKPLDRPLTILGVAANWETRKNFDLFVKLASIMPDARILIVGELPFLQKLRSPQNITFLGRITSSHELADIYSVADIFINPSREETFGMTTIEAMACGTPVITHNTTATPEPVTHGCGIALDTDNLDAVIDAINHITAHHTDFCSTCSQHAIERYTTSAMSCQYINLYKQLHKRVPPL